MNVEVIRSLYTYNRWANERLLTAAAQLPDERTRKHFGASFATIHGTLAHVLAAEIIWLHRWQGESPTKLLDGDDFASLAEIRTRWDQQHREMDAFLATLTPERLVTPLQYTNTRGQSLVYPLWQMMLHVVNHGTHHRSEIADMLTRADAPPPPLDLVAYYAELTGQG